MALESIGLGASANDGTGDDLRTAGGKVNAAFAELYTAFGDGTELVAVTAFGRSLLDDPDAATARATLGLDPTYTALSASRDTEAGDDGADIESTAASAVTLTVVAGTITRGLTVSQMGAGAVTIAAGAGVTINKESDVQAVTNGQYAVAFLKPTGTADTFVLTGSLAAV